MSELDMWAAISFLILTSYWWLLRRWNRLVTNFEGGYPQALRAIGQNLESQRAECFEMVVHGTDYVVRGKARGGLQMKTVSSLIDRIHLKSTHLLGRNGSSAKSKPYSEVPNRTTFQLRITPKELFHLDREGRAKRGKTDRAQNVDTISELLRGAGEYVENTGGRLRAISWNDDVLTITYDTAQGREKKESFRLSSSPQ